MADLHQSFEALLSDYATRKKSDWKGEPFTFGQDLTREAALVRRIGRSGPGTSPQTAPDVAELLQKLHESVTQIQTAMKVIATGVDYRQYARFSMIAPRIVRTMDGAVHIQPQPGLVLTDDDYRFCHQFVISAALRLAEADFDLDLEQLWRQYRLTQNGNTADTP